MRDIIEVIRYDMQESENYRKWVYCFLAFVVLVIITIASLIIVPLVQPTYVYMGEIKSIEANVNISELRINSLINRSKLTTFGSKYEEPWTHALDPGVLNKKKMVSSFRKSFKLKNKIKDNIELNVGDLVKVYAKGSKIKKISGVEYRDYGNAITPVIRGELVSHKTVKGTMFDTEPMYYELEFKSKRFQVKDGSKQLRLKISKEQFEGLDFKVGVKYEAIKEYNEESLIYEDWSFTEIDKYKNNETN